MDHNLYSGEQYEVPDVLDSVLEEGSIQVNSMCSVNFARRVLHTSYLIDYDLQRHRKQYCKIFQIKFNVFKHVEELVFYFSKPSYLILAFIEVYILQCFAVFQKCFDLRQDKVENSMLVQIKYRSKLIQQDLVLTSQQIKFLNTNLTHRV